MTKAKQYSIRAYIAMRNHHEQLLFAAIDRDDASAIAYELKVLSQIKANI
jgi:hypothetical protein